jgi:protein-S-isoprenylcysteine O-methyltransferase Ste14
MIAYALAWIAFGCVHSFSARPEARAWLGRRAGRAMRLVWNLLAVVQLAIVVAIGDAFVPDVPLARPGWLMAVQTGLLLIGIVVLWAATRCYDMPRFLGLAQISGDAGDDEPFRAGGLLAYVRHPLYLAAVILLAALVRDLLSLLTALFATVYILIGMRFEERALLRRFGAEYARYRARVPALLPWRGRAWPAEA